MVQRSNTSLTKEIIKAFYSVICGNKSGTLHTDKLGSGSKGKCIFCESEEKWFTPKEFEKFGGRETSKDWKRSVKLDGKPFYSYVNSGELTIHAFNCFCTICTEGTDISPGPIKYFMPPNRKRRAEDELGMPSMLSRVPSSSVAPGYETDPNDMSQLLSLISQSIDKASEPSKRDPPIKRDPATCPDTVLITTPSLPDIASTSSDIQRSLNSAVDHISNKAILIEEGISTLSGLLGSIKTELASLRNLAEEFKPRGSLSLLNDATPSISETLADALANPDSPTRRKREDSGHCANCNRQAPYKCGRCNLVRYCSEFCQQRDWPLHNTSCGAKIPASTDNVENRNPNEGAGPARNLPYIQLEEEQLGALSNGGNGKETEEMEVVEIDDSEDSVQSVSQEGEEEEVLE